jgi:hypothetical protein
MLRFFAQSLIDSEIEEITHKIKALDGIRTKLERDLLKLQEDELELDDECKFSIFLALLWILEIFGSGRC